MKYRKKPIVIEAEQFNPDKGHPVVIPWSHYQPRDMSFGYINTLEGKMHVLAGVYIVRGIKGEYYPVKPDIFEATYELVSE